MALSENDIDLIQKYLGDVISEEDKRAFDERLSDEEFKEELLLHSKMVDALAFADRNAVVEFLKDENPNDHNIPQSKGKPKPKLLSFLFGLMIGCVTVFWILSNNSESTSTSKLTTPIALAEKYNQVFPGDVLGRGNEDELSVDILDALRAYRQSEFEKALALFEDADLKDEKIVMYKANCKIQLGRYTDALEDLRIIENSSDRMIAQNADWYLGLSLLGSEKTKKAKQKFLMISKDQKHLFQKQAQKILDEL